MDSISKIGIVVEDAMHYPQDIEGAYSKGLFFRGPDQAPGGLRGRLKTMRIRIGNQTSVNAASVMQPFEYAVAHGFDAFEWFPDKKETGQGWTEDDLSKEARAAIKETARERDISLSVHSSLPSDPLDPHTKQLLMKSLELAQDIGATLFNIHFHPGERINRYAESVLPLIKTLSQSGLRLSIENTIETTPEDLNQFFRHLRDLRVPDIASVGVCLDMGHANLCRQTRNDYLRYVDLLGAEVPIIHVHMHENYGDFDNHLTVFTGPSAKDPSGIKGLVQRLKARGFSGNIIFEQWPHPADLLDVARTRLIGIIGNLPEDQKKYPRDFADEIAEANRRSLSWRKRLEWILGTLAGPRKPDIEQLVYIAIYLRFIGTGEVRCGEDGGHYRPSNHARVSQKIYSRLSQLTTAENAFVTRKIYPWLPSFDSPFMKSEPLTRIRDIAHRNDIPQELKKEIKVTLQNKLHRSAGPEDLATSEAVLAKITAPGASYTPAFVEEFRVFHEELKEFFNARSLDEQLESLVEDEDDADAGLVHEFLESKNKMDSLKKVFDTLSLLTRLRNSLSMKLRTATGAESHRLQLIDIRLEEFAFVLLSRLSNYFDFIEEMDWAVALHTLFLAVEGLRLSGFDEEECRALKSELTAWAWDFSEKDDRDRLLRAKATIERCRRLAESYCDKILALFSGRVEKLGRLLGVPEHAIKVFAEGDIRSHPVFQLSKLLTMFLKKIRSLAGLPPWMVIVPGKASGRALAAPGMNSLTVPADERVIALLDKVEGDEDIPPDISAIVAGQDTPLLSHLAVRTRQRRTVFVSCDDKDLFNEFKRLAGKHVLLDASSETVDLRIYREYESGTDEKQPPEKEGKCSEVSISTGTLNLVPLDQVTAENGGNKAFGTRRLQEIAGSDEPGFRTPAGVVVPFGVLEDMLRSSPSIEREYRRLVSGLDALKGDSLTLALEKLKTILAKLRLSDDITTSIRNIFTDSERLMVRSSSNCEDAYGFSGAGVYESVANVAPSEIADALRTVWASLWNLNAVMERRNARISHESAHMAVLIQRMVVPDYSFIMHTINPATNNPGEILIECVPGLGETLASGEVPGSPYRIVFDKQTENVRMLAFASFSSQALPGTEGGIIRTTVNYASISLSRDSKIRDITGILIGRAGRFVETQIGGPQDIEGLTVGDSVYLVQMRPQQGTR